jgi:hypothetical protein
VHHFRKIENDLNVHDDDNDDRINGDIFLQV